METLSATPDEVLGRILTLFIVGGHLTGSVIAGVLAPRIAWIVGMTGGAVLAVREINRGG